MHTTSRPAIRESPDPARGATDLAPTLDDAQRIARHLIGEAATDAEAQRWLRAVTARGAALTSPRERRLWSAAMRHPWLLGPTDAGLAWLDPRSPIRHRLLLMMAILEASPHHHHMFLAAPWPKHRAILLGIRAAWGAFRLAAGIVWVRAHGIPRR